MTSGTTPVRAAGGVVWRRSPQGVEVVVVHRPRYDDWTLPKGKLEPGEDSATAARREVAEETGLECELGVELSSTSYVDQKGRPKIVRYWEMTVRAGDFVPNDEVDRLEWLALERAVERLTHDRDRGVLLGLTMR